MSLLRYQNGWAWCRQGVRRGHWVRHEQLYHGKDGRPLCPDHQTQVRMKRRQWKARKGPRGLLDGDTAPSQVCQSLTVPLGPLQNHIKPDPVDLNP